MPANDGSICTSLSRYLPTRSCRFLAAFSVKVVTKIDSGGIRAGWIGSLFTYRRRNTSKDRTSVLPDPGPARTHAGTVAGFKMSTCWLVGCTCEPWGYREIGRAACRERVCQYV